MESDSSLSNKILLDVCCDDRAIRDLLLERGYEVMRIPHGQRDMLDTEVVEFAKATGSFLITFDGDFNRIDFKNPYLNILVVKGIVGQKSSTRCAVIRYILDNYASELFGNFSTFRAGKLSQRPQNLFS